MPSRQKLGIILENNVCQKLRLLKNVNAKNPKLIFQLIQTDVR